MRSKTLGLILGVFILTLSILACGGGSGGSSGAGGGGGPTDTGFLDLLPASTTFLEVISAGQVTGGSVPDSFQSQFESLWEEYSIGDDILTVYDLESVIRANTADGAVLMMSGAEINFTEIEGWVAAGNRFDNTAYQGQEFWGSGNRVMALLESDGYILFGNEDAVKEVLILNARDGERSLGKASENALKDAYEDVGAGWYMLASDDCDEFSTNLRACEGYAVSAKQGNEDYLVDIDFRFMFRSEQRAESQALDVEDVLDDAGWRVNIEEVEADGTTVKARVSADEEDFRIAWLTATIATMPGPLPTAIPTSTPVPTPTRTPIPTVPPTVAPTATQMPTPTLGPTREEVATPVLATPTPSVRVADTSIGSRCYTQILSEGSITGEWSRSCPSLQDIGRYAHYYKFDLSRDTYVEISLISDNQTDEYLYVWEGARGTGFLWAKNDDYAVGSKIQTVLPRGTYTIEATTYAYNAIDTYTLTLTTSDP